MARAFPVYPIQPSWTSGGYTTIGQLTITTGATTTVQLYPAATVWCAPTRGSLEWLADEVDAICALARAVA